MIMAQIIIDYEEYLKLLEYKKQVEDIQNGFDISISWEDFGIYKTAKFKPRNETLFNLIKDKLPIDTDWYDNLSLELKLYRRDRGE